MELWIRSQDRTTLIKSYEIYISEFAKESYLIRAKRTSHILGAYKTMERALEVLDEIEDRIIKLSALDMIGLPNEQIAKSFNKVFLEDGITNLKAVYEMPIE